MTTFKVEIDESAINDLSNLLNFLKTVMSREGALRYIDVMVEEVQSLSLFAGLYQQSRSMVIRKIHPTARRMLSHNRKWNYVFHIEDDIVVIDHILPSKMIVV